MHGKKRLLPVLTVVSALYVAVGLAVRLTIKDTVPFVSVAYYATPLPVMTFAAVFVGFLSTRARPRFALASLVVGLLCAGWTYQHMYFNNTDLPDPSDRSIVFWNVCSGRLGLSGVVETLKRQNPVAIGLVEIGGSRADATRRWRRNFPGYELTDGTSGILLLTKGRIGEVVNDTLRGGYGRYMHAKVEIDDEELNIVIVDIESDPLRSRRRSIQHIAEIAASLSHDPVLIMGDFNTPGDSVHFKELRASCVSAFESCGNGYSATWPVPLPVLQLDHIWTNVHITLSTCRTLWTRRSDHRPISVQVRRETALQ